MSKRATTIRTIGKVDLHEEIIFNSGGLLVGDWVDLKLTKPNDAPVYGQARVVGYEGWKGHPFAPQSFPIKFKAIRIL